MRIIKVGDGDEAVLRQRAERVRRFGPSLHTLLDEMWATLHEAQGVGLAAPQVGVSQRVAIVKYVAEDSPARPVRYELINPVIYSTPGKEVGREGCLSLPGLVAEVPRCKRISITFQNRYGKSFTLAATGLLARIMQHEVDHLHGRLMTGRAVRSFAVEEHGKD